jgi:hypothetical protein
MSFHDKSFENLSFNIVFKFGVENYLLNFFYLFTDLWRFNTKNIFKNGLIVPLKFFWYPGPTHDTKLRHYQNILIVGLISDDLDFKIRF